MQDTLESPTTSRRPLFHTLAVLGLLAGVVVGLLYIIGAIIGGDFGFLIFAVILAAIYMILASVVWRFGGWWRVLAVIGGALGLFFSAEGLYGLEQPDSFFDFFPTLLGILGSFVALVAGLLSLFIERPATLRPAVSAPQWSAIYGVAGVLGVIAVVSIVLTVTGVDSVSDEERESADVVVVMEDFEFEPETLDLAPGEEVSLVLENDDLVYHTFTIDDLDVDVEFGPGDEKVVEFTVPADGFVRFYCDPHDPEMEGVINGSLEDLED